MIKLKPIIYIVCFSLFASCSSNQIDRTGDEKSKIIRFYKLNSKGQQNRLLIRESRLKRAGCQNFATQTTIYRLTQIGFQYCQVFQEKNCEASSILEGLWKGEKPDSNFSQGGEWLFTQYGENGAEAQSWFCE